ncbi:hypothetical protein V1478_003732 [Vespula squamosa]|uniref:Uncharacterized protein n=1 Tax=Vespula squamosa TaxID=30214 RepID=A0ABD2BMN6_VESSQ
MAGMEKTEEKVDEEVDEEMEWGKGGSLCKEHPFPNRPFIKGVVEAKRSSYSSLVRRVRIDIIAAACRKLSRTVVAVAAVTAGVRELQALAAPRFCG